MGNKDRSTNAPIFEGLYMNLVAIGREIKCSMKALDAPFWIYNIQEIRWSLLPIPNLSWRRCNIVLCHQR
jgi:hypothetical protein